MRFDTRCATNWSSLKGLALAVHPKLELSRAWNRLACRKQLGARFSNVLLAALTRIRSATDKTPTGDQAVSR
jgi:hypothetical protein